MRQWSRSIWIFTLKYMKLRPICAHLQKESSRLGKYQKNDSQKALASSKTAAPFIPNSKKVHIIGGRSRKLWKLFVTLLFSKAPLITIYTPYLWPAYTFQTLSTCPLRPPDTLREAIKKKPKPPMTPPPPSRGSGFSQKPSGKNICHSK